MPVFQVDPVERDVTNADQTDHSVVFSGSDRAYDQRVVSGA
jgi:hypothetical protein